MLWHKAFFIIACNPKPTTFSKLDTWPEPTRALFQLAFWIYFPWKPELGREDGFTLQSCSHTKSGAAKACIQGLGPIVYTQFIDNTNRILTNKN